MASGAVNAADLTAPVPVVLCGKTLEVGEKVTPMIKPEIEVIHFVNSYEYAKENLGDLIAGRGPKAPSGNVVGSHDYSKPPRAVIFGRAFAPEDVKELNRLFRGSGTPVAWIAGDPSVIPPENPGPGYAEKAADNVKRALNRWKDAGANSEDIVYY
ncbi:hypothetical protein GGS23DRAFT_445781 [Durotheca rogersii]|uniref:uncharacterized protein n=1 Tax=Durotheca rogersii TaxID=419775 RepID=UPI00221F2669|nr:uncharacterized protein GGS23DRAFT_445781 [Durotheca rogersii]KAI5855064.1 hypothetical protein GGS23DRAFT_445781 [Durotheca rogersii]